MKIIRGEKNLRIWLDETLQPFWTLSSRLHFELFINISGRYKLKHGTELAKNLIWWSAAMVCAQLFFASSNIGTLRAASIQICTIPQGSALSLSQYSLFFCPLPFFPLIHLWPLTLYFPGYFVHSDSSPKILPVDFHFSPAFKVDSNITINDDKKRTMPASFLWT